MSFGDDDFALYEYDVWNQMIVAYADGTVTVNTYNGDGLRVEKTVDGLTTCYGYEYSDVVLEICDNQATFNLRGLNLISRKTGNDTVFFMYNGHGDVVNLTDGGNSIIATYYYDAFGVHKTQNGGGDNPYRYSGYTFDQETGLYYLKARFYDPLTSRMLSEDTYYGDKTDPLSLNLYTYCANNPIRYWDPTGHMTTEEKIAFIDTQIGYAKQNGDTNLVKDLLELRAEYSNLLVSNSSGSNNLNPTINKLTNSVGSQSDEAYLWQPTYQVGNNSWIFGDDKYTYDVQQKIMALTEAYYSTSDPYLKAAYVEAIRALRNTAQKKAGVSDPYRGVSSADRAVIDAVSRSLNSAAQSAYSFNKSDGAVAMSSAMWGKATAGITGSWVDSSSSGVSRYTYTNVVFGDTYVTVTGLGSWAGVSKAQNLLVTKAEMNALGWKSGKTSIDEVADLNRCLFKYGITTPGSIMMFLATAMFETDYGRLGVENYDPSSNYAYGERGVGACQTTWSNQQIQFLRDMGDSFNGDNTADYINNNYSFWEIGAWEWIGKRLPGGAVNSTIGGYDMNSLICELGVNENVFLASQQYVNRGVSGKDAQGNDNLRGYATGTKAVERYPSNWNTRAGNDKTRLEMYEKAMRYYYNGRVR